MSDTAAIDAAATRIARVNLMFSCLQEGHTADGLFPGLRDEHNLPALRRLLKVQPAVGSGRAPSMPNPASDAGASKPRWNTPGRGRVLSFGSTVGEEALFRNSEKSLTYGAGAVPSLHSVRFGGCRY